MAITTKKVEHNSAISWIVYVKDEDCMPFSDIHAAKQYAEGIAEIGKKAEIFEKLFTFEKEITMRVTPPNDRGIEIMVQNQKYLKSL